MSSDPKLGHNQNIDADILGPQLGPRSALSSIEFLHTIREQNIRPSYQSRNVVDLILRRTYDMIMSWISFSHTHNEVWGSKWHLAQQRFLELFEGDSLVSGNDKIIEKCCKLAALVTGAVTDYTHTFSETSLEAYLQDLKSFIEQTDPKFWIHNTTLFSQHSSAMKYDDAHAMFDWMCKKQGLTWWQRSTLLIIGRVVIYFTRNLRYQPILSGKPLQSTIMSDVDIDNVSLIANDISIAHALRIPLFPAALDDILDLRRDVLRTHMGRPCGDAGGTAHGQKRGAVGCEVAALAAGNAVVAVIRFHDALDADDVLADNVGAGSAAVAVGRAGSLDEESANGGGCNGELHGELKGDERRWLELSK
ncbi:hypothetical protein LOZ58_005622 [Ophidiomyces ophidiicola]|nr:hypothetical protein LOZ58_005622 [Ophidiomyces ophidiicola]